MYSEIKAIYDAYQRGYYFYRPKALPTYSSNHVFDENLSVKKNREMVEEANRKAKEQQTKIRVENDKLHTAMIDDCVEALYSIYSNIPKIVLLRIVKDVYVDKHDSMYEFFNALDSVTEWVNDLFALWRDEEDKKENN